VDFDLSPLHVFGQGISLVSVPYDYTGTNIDAVTVFTLTPANDGSADIAAYAPDLGRYLLYPQLPWSNGRQTVPGRGYWVLSNFSSLFLQQAAPAASPFQVTLLPGWNMIGDPFSSAVDWNLVQVLAPVPVGTTPANSPITVQVALTQHILRGPLWAYSTSQRQYVRADSLQPFAGYWIFVDGGVTNGQPIKLVFTNQSP
jgi:hypothetical protein